MTISPSALHLLLDAYLPEDDATVVAALLAVGGHQYDPHRNQSEFATSFYQTFGAHQVAVGAIAGPMVAVCDAALEVLDLHERAAPHARVTLPTRLGGHTVGGSTTAWALVRAAVLCKFLVTVKTAAAGTMDKAAWHSALSGLRYAACHDHARFARAMRQLGLSDPHGPTKLAADLLTLRSRELHHLGSEVGAKLDAVTAGSDIADLRWKLRSHGYTVSDEVSRNLVSAGITLLNAVLHKYGRRTPRLEMLEVIADAEKVQKVIDGDLSDTHVVMAGCFELPAAKSYIVDTAGTDFKRAI